MRKTLGEEGGRFVALCVHNVVNVGILKIHANKYSTVASQY